MGKCSEKQAKHNTQRAKNNEKLTKGTQKKQNETNNRAGQKVSLQFKFSALVKKVNEE